MKFFKFFKSKIFHRKLKSFIINLFKIGGFSFGYFSFRLTEGSKFEHGSRKLWLWSNIAPLIQLLTVVFTNAPLLLDFTYSTNSADFLNEILRLVSGWTFIIAMTINSIVIIFKKEFIILLLNHMAILHNKVFYLTQHTNYIGKSIRAILTKIIFDLNVVTGTIFSMMAVMSHSSKNTTNFNLFIVFSPISLFNYCLIISLYYISYLWATDLLLQINHEISRFNSMKSHNSVQRKHKLFDLSYCVEAIIAIGKDVNYLFEFIFLWLLLQAFISLVSEVWKFVSRSI